MTRGKNIFLSQRNKRDMKDC
uniref:Uncharacterized protein n=1 Tax=Rhizophora mucronata TaxID=61149 RepID=A0A2P2QF31_RHIMU